MHDEAVSVYATAGSYYNRLHQDTGVEDLATISIGYAGGGVGTMVVGRTKNPAMLYVADDFLHVVGTQGVVTAGWEQPSFLLSDAQAGATRRVLGGASTTALVIDQFVEAVLTGGRPVRDHTDGFAELRVLLAVYDSLREGAAVSISST
jgi:predicted dehydrogenase